MGGVHGRCAWEVCMGGVHGVQGGELDLVRVRHLLVRLGEHGDEQVDKHDRHDHRVQKEHLPSAMQVCRGLSSGTALQRARPSIRMAVAYGLAEGHVCVKVVNLHLQARIGDHTRLGTRRRRDPRW
jgi:hypothetical protein